MTHGIEKGFVTGLNLIRSRELRTETRNLLLLDPGLGPKSAGRHAGEIGMKWGDKAPPDASRIC